MSRAALSHEALPGTFADWSDTRGALPLRPPCADVVVVVPQRPASALLGCWRLGGSVR
jgi:hypothetical protein